MRYPRKTLRRPQSPPHPANPQRHKSPEGLPAQLTRVSATSRTQNAAIAVRPQRPKTYSKANLSAYTGQAATFPLVGTQNFLYNKPAGPALHQTYTPQAPGRRKTNGKKRQPEIKIFPSGRGFKGNDSGRQNSGRGTAPLRKRLVCPLPNQQAHGPQGAFHPRK